MTGLLAGVCIGLNIEISRYVGTAITARSAPNTPAETPASWMKRLTLDEDSALAIEAEVQEAVRLLQAEVAAACDGVQPKL
jgi:hypothetical protein